MYSKAYKYYKRILAKTNARAKDSVTISTDYCIARNIECTRYADVLKYGL